MLARLENAVSLKGINIIFTKPKLSEKKNTLKKNLNDVNSTSSLFVIIFCLSVILFYIYQSEYFVCYFILLFVHKYDSTVGVNGVYIWDSEAVWS